MILGGIMQSTGVLMCCAVQQVHTGVVFTSADQEVLRLNPECGFVLHVLNQFKTRSFSEFNSTDTSWHWALQGSL